MQTLSGARVRIYIKYSVREVDDSIFSNHKPEITCMVE